MTEAGTQISWSGNPGLPHAKALDWNHIAIMSATCMYTQTHACTHTRGRCLNAAHWWWQRLAFGLAVCHLLVTWWPGFFLERSSSGPGLRRLLGSKNPLL